MTLTPKPFLEQLQLLVGKARLAFDTHSVICAGGAVRDTLNGPPVKDIDIFVGLKPEDFDFANAGDSGGDVIIEPTRFTRGAEAFCRYAGGSKFELKTGANPDYANLADFATFQLLVPVHGSECNLFNVEVVGLAEDPIADVSNYDFGLSQCFVTDRSLHLTPACVEDMRRGTITYNDIPRNAAALTRSYHRLQRLRQKYTGVTWKFIGAEKLESLYREISHKPAPDVVFAADPLPGMWDHSDLDGGATA